MYIVAVIQARLGSSRLPGKSLADICGASMLARVVARVQRSQRVNMIGVATTTLPTDDPIERWCVENNVPVFRGHPTDVLDRYAKAAELWRADAVVRVTGDCPCWDATIGDAVIETFCRWRVAYASNIEDTRYVDGTDVEIFSLDLLRRAYREASDPYDREHCTPWMRSDCNYKASMPTKVVLPGVKLSVDTADDLALVRRIYTALGDRFTMKDVARWARKERLIGYNKTTHR